MNSLVRLAALLASAFIAACVPIWPMVTPNVEGHVQLNGKPTEKAIVYMLKTYLGSRPCNTSDIEAVTAADGRFEIEATHSVEWAIPASDGMVSWGICISYKNQWYLGYWELSPGYSVSHPHVRLKCELSEPEKTNTQGEVVAGVCRAS